VTVSVEEGDGNRNCGQHLMELWENMLFTTLFFH